jgi:hypothetical protein
MSEEPPRESCGVMDWLEAARDAMYADLRDLSPEERIAYYQRKVAESEFAELWESLPKIERSRREMGQAAS